MQHGCAIARLQPHAAFLLLAVSAVAADVKYTLVVNEIGSSGNCRGNSGSHDLINSKWARVAKESDCRAECTRLGKACVGFTYGPASEYCAIHGPGMSGICSVADKSSKDECGICSLPGTSTRLTCGECSVKPSSGWAETENFCQSVANGKWTAATWTEGAWTEPGGGWTGDSYRTTHVHTVDGAADAYCYDKYPYDGVPQCKGTLATERDEAEQLCQTEFDANHDSSKCPVGCDFRRAVSATALMPRQPPSCLGVWGEGVNGREKRFDCSTAFNEAATAAMCVGPQCQFVPAPSKTTMLVDTHAPILYLPGWKDELRSAGDLVGSNFATGTIGVCGVEGNGGKAINSKRCSGSTCIASNGMSVSLQEGCAQACLDDPSGACVGYAHSSSDCILYSPHADRDLVHQNGNVWTPDMRPTEPCLSFDSPKGCKTLNAAIPNPSYICITLKTTPERWAAWGLKFGKREAVSLRITTSGAGEDKYTAEVQKKLRLKIAALTFVNKTSDDIGSVVLEISQENILSTYEGPEVLLEFVVAANESTAAAMRKLIDAQLSTSALANSHLRPFLPDGAFIAAVTPAGASVWPRDLSTAEMIGIVVGVVVAVLLGAFLAWKCLQEKAKAEAQQMHFAVANGLEGAGKGVDEETATRFTIHDIDRHSLELGTLSTQDKIGEEQEWDNHDRTPVTVL